MEQTSCLLCMTGYYMHSDRNCYKNGTKPLDKPIDGGTDNGETDNGGETTSGYMILMFWNAIMILLFM